jgi:hypothetical protein
MSVAVARVVCRHAIRIVHDAQRRRGGCDDARWRPASGEAVSREKGINPKLTAAGWTVTPYQAAYSFYPPLTVAVEERTTIAAQPTTH